MTKKLLIGFILLFASNSFAQVQVTRDELPNTNSTDSTSVLNNVLRQNQNAINSIGGYFNSNGYLSEANGGTGTNLSAIPNGSILIQDASNVGIGTFGQGTSGQVIVSAGASAKPQWTTLNSFSSTVSFSGTPSITTTGNVGIGSASPDEALIVNGQIGSLGTIPTCGTGCNSIVTGATDVRGQGIHASTNLTTFSITFGATWARAPICLFQDLTTKVVLSQSSSSTTAVTATSTTSMTNNDGINWICLG